MVGSKHKFLLRGVRGTLAPLWLAQKLACKPEFVNRRWSRPMPTLAKTSPFAPSRKGAPRYLCESHGYAGNNRWALWPHARDASGEFRLFQVRNGSSPAIQDLGHEGAGMPTPLPQHQLKLRGRFRAHLAAYRFITLPIPTVGALGARRDQRAHCCCGQSPSSQGQSIHSVASAFRRRTPSRQQIQSRWYAERAPSKPLQSRNRFLNGAPAR